LWVTPGLDIHPWLTLFSHESSFSLVFSPQNTLIQSTTNCRFAPIYLELSLRFSVLVLLSYFGICLLLQNSPPRLLTPWTFARPPLSATPHFPSLHPPEICSPHAGVSGLFPTSLAPEVLTGFSVFRAFPFQSFSFFFDFTFFARAASRSFSGFFSSWAFFAFLWHAYFKVFPPLLQKWILEERILPGLCIFPLVFSGFLSRVSLSSWFLLSLGFDRVPFPMSVT